MTRPKPPLHQHLLTRSDLARLQVPAGEVLSWLADGLIEQVGILPGAEGAPDPVFTVLSNRLRQDLALRLIGIGKPTVVLTPLRVRSFLMRALMGTASDGQAMPTATIQDEQDLADVLREVVAEVEADVDDVLRLAAEEAGLEAAAAPSEGHDPAATAAPATTEPMQDAGGAAAGHVDALPTEVEEGEDAASSDEESELDPCFDADAIDAALNALDADAAPAADAPAPSVDLAAEASAPSPDDAVAGATEHPAVAAVTDTESPAAVEPAPSDPVVAVESIALTGIEVGIVDRAEVSNPDISMASETTMSSQPEAAAQPDSSTPVAAPVAAAVEAPSTQPGEPMPGASTAEAASGSPDQAEAPTASATAVAAEVPASQAAPTTAPAEGTAIGDHAIEAPTESGEPEPAEPPAAPAPLATEAPAMEPAPTPASGAANPEAIVHAAAEAVLERTVQRVESFLGELQKSLLTIAQRPEATPPPPPPAIAFDVAPLVNALQAGLERSAQANAAMQAALSSLGERVNGVGERMAAVAEGATGVGTHVEHGIQSLDKTLQALQSTVAHREAPKSERVVPGIVVATGDRMPTVMIAVAALVIAWSAVFWMKMDSPRLAIATLIGANLVSCCLLVGRRARS